MALRALLVPEGKPPDPVMLKPIFYDFNEKMTIEFVDGFEETEIVDRYKPCCPCCGSDKECIYVSCCMK
jgi:hypothetical protein